MEFDHSDDNTVLKNDLDASLLKQKQNNSQQQAKTSIVYSSAEHFCIMLQP